MSIVRAPRPASGFYILDKAISEDPRLGWAARGLLVFLLGKPDHWQVSITHLVNQTREAGKRSGRDAVYSILSELEGAGYITRRPRRAEGGEFTGTEYVVSESPRPEKPDTVPPNAVDPFQARTEGKAKTEGEQGKKNPLEGAGRQATQASGRGPSKAILHDKSLHGKDYAKGATADDRFPPFLQ